MQVSTQLWQRDTGWNVDGALAQANLVLVFGVGSATEQGVAQLRAQYPDTPLIGCSTAGEIFGTEVFDDTLSATALSFNSTQVRCECVEIDAFADSRLAGEALAAKVAHEDLRHVLVLSDGLQVNGSELIKGLNGALPESVTTSGGLAGDGDAFENTQIVFGDTMRSGLICCAAFYGKDLVTSCASLGGWDVFGPDRIVTRSEGNVLFELDGRSALELYKEYLGDYANELPGSGLLFPLNVGTEHSGKRVVRTILGVDEQEQSLTFAGDVPEGARAQLMRANFDRLVDGAIGAATHCQQQCSLQTEWQFALLISCVGRRMVLQQRVEEELEGVSEVLGCNTALSGFYSYGELAPFVPGDACELHNQTMTITTFKEIHSA